MSKKILFAVLFGTLSGLNAAAQANPVRDSGLAGSAAYSDPGFQDFIETSYGYLNPLNQPGAVRNFRDAPASSGNTPLNGEAASLKTGRTPPASGSRVGAEADKYVFVTILLKTRNYSRLLEEISASSGFILRGERTSHSKNAREVRLLGWARAAGLSSIHKNPGVAGVHVRTERPARSGKAQAR